MITYKDRLIISIGPVQRGNLGWEIRAEVAEFTIEHGGIVQHSHEWITLFSCDSPELAERMRKALSDLEDWRKYW